MIATKTLAIVTLHSTTALDWINEYASVDWLDDSSFALDRVFLAELLDEMDNDGLGEDRDYTVTLK